LLSALETLRGLKATHGVFFVTGNHEYYWNAPRWIHEIKKLGIQVLTNEGKMIPLPDRNLWIGGVPDVSAGGFDPSTPSRPALAMPPVGSSECLKILLAHQPKSCFEAQKAGFDLMLSGHTHWGQFFPFNYLVGFFNPYHKALNNHEGMWVYVNSGTGFWGPPLRLGVPSEITLIQMRQA
jgi:predicted MPP superfamily phosphohydrolase